MKSFAVACGIALAALSPFTFTAISAQQINPSVFSDLRWRNIGPWRSGYVSAPTGVPGDSTTYYVGLPEGGVWKTTNGGTTWKPIFDQVEVPSVGAVAVAPSDHNVIYVGTGNQSGWSFTPGKGIYKSTDAGRTWTNVGLRDSEYIGSIAVDPRNADVAIVAALGPRAPGGRGAARNQAATAPAGERGVYRTSDGGRTWTRVLPADGAVPASDVYLDYDEPQIVYALLGTGGGFGAAPQPEISNTGIYKSSDEGVTWQAVSGHGLPDGARVMAFTMADGTHGRRLYALVATGGGRGAAGRGAASRGLYRSDDGGETWVFGTREIASAGGKIYADPQHPDVVYLMGTSMYRSTDAGAHVISYWGAPSGADPRFLWIDPTNAKRMIGGVDQGPMISVDGGESWTPYYGLIDGQFYRVATDYDFPYHVCGPQQDSGTACAASRTDFGEIRPYDWYPAGGFENGFLIADPLDHRYMYTQGWYHVLRRFDKVTSQVVVLYQPTPDDRFGGAPPLAFSPENPHELYMASQRVLTSSDGGTTWRAISPDLASGTAAQTPPVLPPPPGSTRGPAAAGGYIQALAPSPVSTDVIWAGSSTGLVHVTRDHGRTWTNVTPKNLPPSAINVIDASHANAGTAYAALLSRDAHPHIYRTSDYGGTWQEITTGIADDGTARVVREDPKDPNLLYAGTVTSIWVSFDRGDHWQPLQLNLPHTVVSDITVHDDDIAISTYGRGFWILDDVTPLRQARAALASSAPAFFFKPAPVSRARWDNTQDTPVPPEMVIGPNPPEGAILDYYLAAAASGTVTLRIKDARGATVREFSSIAPPIDTSMPNVPEYWIAPPITLPTSAGMHRVSWDLRYPDPPILNYGYSGTLLDYREYTLNWHAIPGKTYRSTVVGPMVLPGPYSATLTVNGQSFTQPIALTQDPRISVPAAGLEAQFRLEERMVAGITATYDAVTYLDKLTDALSKLSPQSGDSTAAGVQSLETALKALAAGGGALGLAHRDLTRRINDQLVGDAAPTPSVTNGVDEPCAAIDRALAELRRIETTDVAQLNTSLSHAGPPALPVWTPPTAPACGAK
ncbi:MAG: WD40/YVTN/BNR-like repeat-containing protein [Vicinamibacterales bacterium]